MPILNITLKALLISYMYGATSPIKLDFQLVGMQPTHEHVPSISSKGHSQDSIHILSHHEFHMWKGYFEFINYTYL